MAPHTAADTYVRGLIEANPNMLVPHYLMASYLYYELDLTVISDELYNEICVRLQTEKVSHMHSHLVDPEALIAGTAYHLTGNYPEATKGGAHSLYWMFNPHELQRRRRQRKRASRAKGPV